MADEADPLAMLDEPEGVSGEAPSAFSGGDPTAVDLSKFAGMGPLLEEADDEKVVHGVTKFVVDTKRARARRRAEWERNRFWVKGIRGVELKRVSEDSDELKLSIPLGSFDMPPVMDRCDELLEKRVSHLVSDPAVPEGEPATESDEDRDGAEFTTRLLTAEGSESGYNNQMIVRRALRKASIYGSAFVYSCVDPTGGGWQPMECRATKDAPTLDVAGKMPDPTTGELIDAPDEMLTTRYVMPDKKTLTDDPTQAARQWLPKIRKEILTGEHIVLIPETCSGIADADGVVMMRPTTWGRLCASFPQLKTLPLDEQKAICEWRPEDSKKTIPRSVSSDKMVTGDSDTDKVPDNAAVVPLVLYFRSHGSYPKGAYIICVGEKTVLHRDFHVGMVEGKEQLTEECLELPFSQFRDLDDDLDDDPYGRATAAKLGPADEIRGEIVLAWLDYLERFSRPHTFLPLGSIIQPNALTNRDGNPIMFNPQGKPEQETVPNFPADAKEFFDRLGSSQDSASLLEATAQGVDSSNSISGVAKQAVIQQAHVNLTTTRANTADGQERDWRIHAQLVRVYWTIPSKLKVLGDDGMYKLEEWTRASLGSTRDIKIARGSFTQQSPEQKQADLDARMSVVDANGQPLLVSPDEYVRLSSSNLKARHGMQDNPHRMRARRQIGAWRKGPPMGDEAFVKMVAGFEQAMQLYQQQVAALQAQAAPMVAGGGGLPTDGVSAPAAPVEPGPVAAVPAAPPMPPAPVDPVEKLNPFDQLPIDAETDIAKTRWAEQRAEIAGTGYRRKHPRWQKFLLDAYAKSKQDAGVMTIADQQKAQADQVAAQQKAQADQAAAQQDTELKKEQLKLDGQRSMHAENLRAKQVESTAKTEGSEADRAFQAEQNMADRAAKANEQSLRDQGADIPGAMAGAST